MATCSVPVSCLFKNKYYHLRLNKAKYQVLSNMYASRTFIVSPFKHFWLCILPLGTTSFNSIAPLLAEIFLINFVSRHYTCTTGDIISGYIGITGKLEYLWNKKRYHKTKTAILLYFEKPFKVVLWRKSHLSYLRHFETYSKQVDFMSRKMLFTVFKYLFSFQRYPSF